MPSRKVSLVGEGDGCVTASQVAVYWISGAAAAVPSARICSAQQTITVLRPVGFDGLDVDTQFALLPDATRTQATIPASPLNHEICSTSMVQWTVTTTCAVPMRAPYRVDRVIR